MKYEILVSDRKEVVKKVEELAGKKPRYTGMPEAAYVLDGIVIAKDNTMTADDDADANIVVKLIEERMIRMLPEESDDWDDPDEEDAEEDNAPVRTQISFPLENHSKESIVNLVCTIYSKGGLISKSTGGKFAASDELLEALQTGKAESAKGVIRTIEKTAGGLLGISFYDDKVCFDGFPASDDPAKIRAWTQLAAVINKNAIDQKHIRASRTEVENEKYAFRTWLTRLGMKGDDTKEERRILYRNLNGHTAFRTEADREKWKASMKARKEAGKGTDDDSTENE